MSYRKPGSTDISTGSGRTTRRGRTFIDPAMATLEATRGFTEKFGKRVNDVRDYENEVAQRNINLQDKVEGLKDLEDLNPFSYLQNDLMDMVSNINKLDIESFEGDRSAYNKELSKINRILNNYQSFVGGLDATIDEYQAKSPTELHRDISRTALQNDPRVAKYRKFLDNPSKAKFKIEDGEMVVYNGDERLFNAVEFVNSTKKGFQMVPYTPDMSDKITEVQSENYKGLDGLTKKIIDVEIKGKNRDYNSLTSTEKINYEKAIDAYVDRLKNDPAVDALVNESTFQRFITGNDVYDKTKDESKTKDELIKFMVKEQFAGGKEVDVLVKERLAAKPRKGKEESIRSYDKWISENITKKTKQTRYHDSPKEVTAMFDIPLPEKRKKVLEKIRSFNKVDLVYGSDDRVADAKGSEADPNKLYQLVKVPGAGSFNAFEVTVSDEDILNNKALNKLLIDYDVKFNKSSVL